jgi:hypothetical protein
LTPVVYYLLNKPFVGAGGGGGDGSFSLLDDVSSATDLLSEVDLSFSF